MNIIADASAFLAVALEEAGESYVVEHTKGCNLVSPEVLPYEIANALIAGAKRRRITARDVHRAFSRSQRIVVQLVPVNVYDALQVALRLGIYAYDAYYLQCAIETGFPLLSLDGGMNERAKALGIEVVG